MRFGEVVQSADWKKEKHVPVITAPEQVKAGEPFIVKIQVGAEIPHPNTAAHHISWVDLYFKPDGDKFIYHVGHFDFAAHGASAQGADAGPVYTNPTAKVSVTLKASGALIAVSSCNIHGIWESSKAITVEA